MGRINRTLGLLQGFFWCSHCSIFAFLVVYLLKHGYGQMTIGWAMTLLSLVSVFSPMILGYIGDFWVPIKKIVVLCLLLSIPSAIFLRYSVGVVPLAFVSVGLLGMLQRSLPSVIDSWGMKLQAKYPAVNYGATRSVGSISYAITALVLGRLFDAVGLEYLFVAHAIFTGIAVIWAASLQGVPVQRQEGQDSVSFVTAMGALLHNKAFMLLLIGATLSGFTNAVTGTFSPMLITQLGGNNSWVGLALFVSAFSEFPTMLSFNRISRKFTSEALVAAGMLAACLRSMLPAFIYSLPLLMLSNTLQAVSFGIYLPALMYHTVKVVEPRFHATAITFLVAFREGLAGMMGNALGGYISDQLGLRWTFILLSSIAATGFVLFTSVSLWQRQALRRL